MSKGLVLAGDIGGTKSNLGLFRGQPKAPIAVIERTYPNREYGSLVEVVRRFIDEVGLLPDRACFGVAGAVVEGESTLPNLDWRLSESSLAETLKLRTVCLINDLEANALGLATLEAGQLVTLNPGKPRHTGNRALISAGTGLGMAILTTVEDRERVLASEGGHMDFAPRGSMQAALLDNLAERHGHVSIERVVSGQGLVNIFDFLRTRGEAVPDGLLRRFEVEQDRAAAITQVGLAKEAAICTRSLELFLSVYGAAAGNLALMALTTGGLFIGGGIAPRLIGAFPASGFMSSFIDKGRFAGLLAEVPVHVVMEPKTALRGAARRALGHRDDFRL